MKLWWRKNPTEQVNFTSYTSVKRKLVIISVLVGLLVVMYYLFINNTSSTSYTYTNLQPYQLQGSIPGSSMAFLKPSDFTEYKKANDQIALRQESANSKNNQSSIAFLSAASTSEATAYTDSELLSLKTNFAHPDNNYSVIAGPITTFVKNWLPVGWEVNLDKAKPFTNKSITDNAWQFAISAKDPSKKAGTYSGRAVYAINGQNFYYFTLTTTANNWQKNAPVWQQIFDSLQINR